MYDIKIFQKCNFKRFLPYIFILLTGFIVFLKPLGSGDELWNYNFARNIVQGNIPYRDFSIVQTPLSCYISAIFMFILGDSLFTFRVITYLLFIVLALLVFDLCKKSTNSVGVAICATAFVTSAHFLPFIYNYNYLTALLLLLIFEMEIKEKDKLVVNFVIGLMVGLIPLIKQNTGIIICFANVIICLRHCVKKPNLKKVYFLRVLSSFIPFIIYVIYLLSVGVFNDFMEYAILGISTFTHRYTLLDFCKECSFFVPYLIIIILAYIMIGRKIYKTKISDYQFSTLVFSIAWSSIIYPLADTSHILLVLFTIVPTFTAFYSFKRLRRKEVVVATVVSIFIFYLLLIVSLPIEAKFNISKLENCQGMIIDEEVEFIIKTVDKYILQKEKEGYKVRIADTSAAAYKIPLNKYEKNWDMLLVGNLGLNNVQNLLKSDKPTLYLVSKDDSVYSLQDYYELINYIKNNYDIVDEVAGFYVYANEY